MKCLEAIKDQELTERVKDIYGQEQ